MADDPSYLPSIISAASGLIGTIIGGMVTYLAQRGQHASDRNERRQVFAGAVAAEIGAYIELVRQRNHAASAHALLQSLRSGKNVELSTFKASGLSVKEFFPIFFAQPEMVGTLGAAAPDLARFFTKLSGVIATMKSFEFRTFHGLPIEERIRMVEQEVELWEDTLKLGDSLTARLRGIAGMA